MNVANNTSRTHPSAVTAFRASRPRTACIRVAILITGVLSVPSLRADDAGARDCATAIYAKLSSAYAQVSKAEYLFREITAVLKFADQECLEKSDYDEYVQKLEEVHEIAFYAVFEMAALPEEIEKCVKSGAISEFIGERMLFRATTLLAKFEEIAGKAIELLNKLNTVSICEEAHD